MQLSSSYWQQYTSLHNLLISPFKQTNRQTSFMDTLRRQSVLFYGLVLLCLTARTQAQNCLLESTCSALSYPKLTSIGYSGPSENTYLSCPWRASTSAVAKINWLFSPDLNTPATILDIDSDPKLSLSRFSLVISNISSENEGIYYCKVQYSDGSESIAQGAGCAFVAGRAQFKTCPEERINKECRGITHLEGEEQSSVEFDARLDYNYGGDCGLKQSVRQMYLNRIDDNGNSETLFICSNLGSYGSRSCVNRTHVSITYQGEDKYDLKLSLHSLSMSNSGRYQLLVNLNEMSGRRSKIINDFSVTVRAKPTLPPTLPPVVLPTQAPTGTECSEDTSPLLMLNGTVLERDSSLAFGSIMEGGQALLCVTHNKQCCDTEGAVTADFLYPNSTPVDENSTQGIYLTRGKQVIRLNHVAGPADVDVSPPEGSYCCSVPASDGTRKNSCINLTHETLPIVGQ